MKDLLIIGAGAMGGALARGIAAAGDRSRSIGLLDRHLDKAEPIAREFEGIEAVAGIVPAKVYLVAVKPYHVRELLGQLPRGAGIISIAAGITLDQLADWAPEGSVLVRAMPNTACEVREGVTALTAATGAERLLELSVELFSLVGMALVVEEKLFNLVSAISGSGPAYVFMMIEAIQEAGITFGLKSEVALDLAVATVKGAGILASQRGGDPRGLRLKVTSPGGMTAAAIRVFEENRLRYQFIEAIGAAIGRAEELSRNG